MTPRLPVLVLLLCAAGLLSAAPMTARKPGLWEVQTQNSAGAMPNVQEMLDKLPPAQRAQVQQAMKQHGVAAGQAPNSYRYCMSAAQVDSDAMPPTDPDTHCTRTAGPSSAGEGTFSFSCKRKDGSSVEGQGRAYDMTPESYAMDMTMTMQAQGQPMKMTVQQKGRWLGADCKGLKPLGNK
jgi:hypothetical protein